MGCRVLHVTKVISIGFFLRYRLFFLNHSFLSMFIIILCLSQFTLIFYILLILCILSWGDPGDWWDVNSQKLINPLDSLEIIEQLTFYLRQSTVSGAVLPVLLLHVTFWALLWNGEYVTLHNIVTVNTRMITILMLAFSSILFVNFVFQISSFFLFLR